jgi:glucose-1-phosphate cytidylyltransferase
MKAVLFCGGPGIRLPEHTETIPKPMITIGYRPLLWHVMRTYAHWGVNDFVLCLGYKADVIKDYFLNYNEALSNDFVLTGGGHRVELLSTDIEEWRITFADTGLHANIGQRMWAARRYLDGEGIFCANYGDVVTDAPLPELLADFGRRDKVAAFLSVHPQHTFHTVRHAQDGVVTGISDVHGSDLWINGGYFIFRSTIFDYLGEGEELFEEPFQRLVAADQLVAYRYEGFWTAVDTLKDLQNLETLHESGRPPWAVWLEPGDHESADSRDTTPHRPHRRQSGD